MNYQWGDHLLDTKLYRLLRSGERVDVEPQVFDLLVYLIENRDRVVTRDELLNNVWKGRIVSDNALNARLKEARKAVGDSGNKQAVVQTIHGRGYQFIAQVMEVGKNDRPRSTQGQDETVPRRTRSAPSIGVVRFSNLSNDPEQQYFSDGISTNIWSGLARIRSLIVKSALNHDHHTSALETIGKELEVDYLLTGSVQREGEHVRVFVELIDCESGETKWSEKYDRIGTGAIEIQDDIARAIIATLWNFKGKIREAEFEHLARKTAKDFTAFDFILKGIAAKEKYTREGNLEAHYYFNQAKSLEPENAEALAWSSVVYILDVIMGFADDYAHSLKQAYSEANRAISVDRNSEMGHWTLAFSYSMDRRYDKAFAEFDIALEINPNNPDTMVSKGCEMAASGLTEEGIELILQGFRFNKSHPEWYWWHLGIAYFSGEKFGEAIDSFTQMSEQNNDTRTYLTASYALQGNQKDASACLQEIFQADPRFTVDRISDTHRHLSERNFGNLQRGLQAAFRASTKETVIRLEG